MILSVDDACSSDTRIAKLAKKYNIETIFYWPVELNSLAYDKGYTPLTWYEARQIAKDFEVGSHTITHRHLTKIPTQEAMDEIAHSKEILQKLFDKPITKFCPPRGYTNEELTEYTLEIYDSQRLTRGKGLVHIHPNSGANGERPWRDCIDKNTKELWCHSWELDKFDLWEELEEFLRENTRC